MLMPAVEVEELALRLEEAVVELLVKRGLDRRRFVLLVRRERGCVHL